MYLYDYVCCCEFMMEFVFLLICKNEVLLVRLVKMKDDDKYMLDIY